MGARVRLEYPSRQAQAHGAYSPERCVYPVLITADETAALLRTSRHAVYAMVGRGQLPGVTRIGRRMLFRSDELLDWVRQKSAPSPKG